MIISLLYTVWFLKFSLGIFGGEYIQTITISPLSSLYGSCFLFGKITGNTRIEDGLPWLEPYKDA